jgi:arabinan endo-1,5-alpha-L-arabinosidase
MRGHLSFVSNAIQLAVAGSILGCGGGGSSTQVPMLTATTASLGLSSSSVNVGASVTLTATVATSGGGVTVTTGSVTFYDGAASMATTALNSSGQAAWSSTALAAGAHSLTAAYGGNTSYSASTSSAKTLTVTVPTQQSTLALTASAPTATQGLPVELVATVAAVSGSGSAVPTGTVTFVNSATTLGTAWVDSTGVANFTSTKLPVSADSITASYSGDATYGVSTASAVSVSINVSAASTYTNPLTLNVNSTVKAVSCADPASYKDQVNGVNTWYLYCTSDALYPGDPSAHLLNVFKSSDLVNYSYVGNGLSALPSWGNISADTPWAPAIKYIGGQYLLYYAAPATTLAGGANAIGVGIGSTPAGPFVDSGTAVIAPELAPTTCCTGYRSTIDPDEIQDTSGQRYILYGSFNGGLWVRTLSADGLTSDPTSEVHVAADSRYEGGNWWYHGGYYYLFASSANCCNGPLSGYSVFVGRATTPLGPYLDAQGIDMAAFNPGGTPVIGMNGNNVVGPGGNVIFTDEAGQDYMLYHGILLSSPFYTGSTSYTARPAFIDALDWVNGWPVVRDGFGPSDVDAPQPLPAAQPKATNSYTTVLATQDAPRTLVKGLSDDFAEATLGSQWSFLNSTPNYTLTGSAYQVQSVGYDTVGNMPNVPLLAESAPLGDYIIETEVDLNIPVTGDGSNYPSAGVLIVPVTGTTPDPNNFIRVDLYNNNDARQVEFIKVQTAAVAGYPTFGATNQGPPALSTVATVTMRLVKRNVNGEEHYTAYSSNDGGVTWSKSGTWIHSLGNAADICLYAGNTAGYTADFHYIHVSTLQ